VAKAPIAVVKERFGSKDKLVKAVRDLADKSLFVEQLSEDKGLDHVSNQKLLRLHDVLSAVKEKFGSRDKLVAAILGQRKRDKDEGLKARLDRYPTPRLYDLFRSTDRTVRRAS
jgi:hypothetical protein